MAGIPFCDADVAEMATVSEHGGIGHRSAERSAVRSASPVRRALTCGGVLALAIHFAHGQLGLGGHAFDAVIGDWLLNAFIAAAAASCLLRARRVPAERLAWVLLALGLLLDVSGDVYFSLVYGDSSNASATPADAFYLLYYPVVYGAIVLLMRQRMEHFSANMWIDGAIAATTAAAVTAAIAFDPILGSSIQGSVANTAVNLAYPVGDLALLAIVVIAFALIGWRPGRVWLLLGLGLGVSSIADTADLYQLANNTYHVGGMVDSLWVLSALLVSLAPWQQEVGRQERRFEGTWLLLVPGAFGMTALAVLVYAGFRHVNALGLILAGVAILLVIVRAAWTFRENLRLLETSRHDAVTDALTGLGNRRLMTAELERALADGPASPPAVLAVFDLDGFKLYNDRFGHMAGDTLLALLGHRLELAVVGAGSAFRPGGDEFCVLLSCKRREAEARVAAAASALAADGDGFSVTASFGRAWIPSEADTPSAALRLADDRMYAQKGGRRGSARQQTHDVLLGVLREREPKLHAHLREVGRLARIVGSKLGMREEELDELHRAAELHDIGKAAVPDTILTKAGPLEEQEWAFMRRHTLIGERILLAAPALAPAAGTVRSSHERWDGTGYPDRLRGEAIPLAARIVAVCDAFDAITSDRPYAPARARAQAIDELRAQAGTQFDPNVVEAFLAALEQLPAARLRVIRTAARA
ncbi:MAG: diguanylate cyclase [Actinomycetota bacterium]|nr:diguanylate cyclase [Actinomycetota bacterium]